MEKKCITSTVIISVLVLSGLFWMRCILPVTLADLAVTLPEGSENMGMMLMFYGAVAGIAFLTFCFLDLAILITHSICLIFTVKNRRSCLKSVRIINYVLDGLNVLLIAAALIKLILWRLEG